MKEGLIPNKNIQPDAWTSLQKFTAARIALGRTGTSVPLPQTLSFQLDHAHARDAVYAILKTHNIQYELDELDIASHVVHSKAKTREEYLQRPDLGRSLDKPSCDKVSVLKTAETDAVFILADGLSAQAINKHAIPVLRLLLSQLKAAHVTIAPVILAEQSRVALADEIGFSLGAKLSVIFIGERPGLSSPDSMGVYITYNPQLGTTDESRNCISNIRPEGLGYAAAADKIFYFIKECLRLKLSGVRVKDLNRLIG